MEEEMSEKLVQIVYGMDGADPKHVNTVLDKGFSVSLEARKKLSGFRTMINRPKGISNDDYRQMIIDIRPWAMTASPIDTVAAFDRLAWSAKGWARAVNGYIVVPVVNGGIMEGLPTDLLGIPLHFGLTVKDAWLHLEAAHLGTPVHIMDGTPKEQVAMALFLNVKSVSDSREVWMHASRGSFCDVSGSRWMKTNAEDEWGNKFSKDKVVVRSLETSVLMVRSLWECAGFEVGG